MLLEPLARHPRHRYLTSEVDDDALVAVSAGVARAEAGVRAAEPGRADVGEQIGSSKSLPTALNRRQRG